MLLQAHVVLTEWTNFVSLIREVEVCALVSFWYVKCTQENSPLLFVGSPFLAKKLSLDRQSGVVTVESSFTHRNESAQDYCRATFAKFGARKCKRSGNMLRARHQSVKSEAFKGLINQSRGSLVAPTKFSSSHNHPPQNDSLTLV